MAQVTIHEAKTNLSKLIARALDGEDVVIAKGAEPKVRLVPIRSELAGRQPGRFRGQFSLPDSFFDPMTDEELKDWGY